MIARKRTTHLRRWWCGLRGHPLTESRCESRGALPESVTFRWWEECRCGEYSTPHVEKIIPGCDSVGGA